MVVRQSTLLALAGAGIGAGIAWLLTPRMASMLHDVEPRDLLSFAAACILVIAVSLAASWIPARRASRVDPMVALREE